MKLNKWTRLLLKSVIAGLALTLLSYFVTSYEELGSSCYRSVYRGTPFSYELYNSSATLDSPCSTGDNINYSGVNCADCSSTHLMFMDTQKSFIPAEFIADIVMWSGSSFVVLFGVSKLPKIKHRKKN
jgi:hypothetical protein